MVVTTALPLQIALALAVAVIVRQTAVATERVATETEVAILDAGEFVVLVGALSHARLGGGGVARETFGKVT